MADIIQAAKWMRKGIAVTRKSYSDHHYLTHDPNGSRRESDNIVRRFMESESTDLILRVSDLLADDWEKASK